MRDLNEVWDFVKKEDFLGTSIDVIEFMQFEEVKERNLLKEDHIRKIEQGEELWEPAVYNEKNIIQKIKDYLPFAWEKANDCRGISSTRSIIHFRNWFYMLGNKYTDKLVKEMNEISYYGKPWLYIISELVNETIYDDELWGDEEYSRKELSDEKRNAIINFYKSKLSMENIKEYLSQWI